MPVILFYYLRDSNVTTIFKAHNAHVKGLNKWSVESEKLSIQLMYAANCMFTKLATHKCTSPEILVLRN